MTITQIEKAITSLPVRQQLRVLQSLEQRLFARRVDHLACSLRNHTKTRSYKKITAITNRVREQLHGKSA